MPHSPHLHCHRTAWLARPLRSTLHVPRSHGLNTGHSDVLVVILGALAIVIGASAVGLAVNRFSPHRIPVFAPPAASVPTIIALPKGLEAITIAEAKAVFDKRGALFLDARPPDQYAEGHIPGALNLPADAFDDTFPNLADQIEASPFIIVSCEGGECSDSIHVAERLIEYGFLGTRVMLDGFRSWADAGYPVTLGSSP